MILLDKAILLQALNEGYVILSIIKLLLIGPPAVGKTSFKHLLFNWKPPRHHHSTAIADRPIRAVERIATVDGAKSWELITTEDLMQMLAEDIHTHAIYMDPETDLSDLSLDIEKSIEVSANEMEARSVTFHSEDKVLESSKSPSSSAKSCPEPLSTLDASGQLKKTKGHVNVSGNEHKEYKQVPHKHEPQRAETKYEVSANEMEAQSVTFHSEDNVLESSKSPSYPAKSSPEPLSPLDASDQLKKTKGYAHVSGNKYKESKQVPYKHEPQRAETKYEGSSLDQPLNVNGSDTNSNEGASIIQLSQSILTKMGKVSQQQLSKSTWIYVLDSGGQPQFADVSRPFVRGNTINVIVHKLTDRLASKPVFQYSIEGEALTQPKELRMSNLELITTFVRSISSAKLVDGNECTPTFLIIGTYNDKMGGLRRPFQESIEEKNAQLISSLKPYKDQLIFYNQAKQQLIIPVDNMKYWNREKLSSLIRTYVTGHEKAIVKRKTPIRWYVLESNIKDESNQVSHGIVSRAHCEEIGVKLGMTRAQISRAIQFFKSFSVFLHFESYSHLVFTNPQYFLDALSSIIRVSFVDFPEKVLQKGKVLPPNVHQRLRDEGLFTEDFLDLVSIQFAQGLFEKSDLLHLLCDLCIIAEVRHNDKLYYFIPSALSPKQLTYEEKKKIAISCEPLVLSFDPGVVPQVCKII